MTTIAWFAGIHPDTRKPKGHYHVTFTDDETALTTQGTGIGCYIKHIPDADKLFLFQTLCELLADYPVLVANHGKVSADKILFFCSTPTQRTTLLQVVRSLVFRQQPLEWCVLRHGVPFPAMEELEWRAHL